MSPNPARLPTIKNMDTAIDRIFWTLVFASITGVSITVIAGMGA